MVESFSSILDVEYLDKSITSMISMVGGDVKEGLNFEDFKNLMLGLERHSNQPRGRHGRRLSEAVIGTDINRIQKPPPPKNYRRRLSSAVIETIDLTKASREALRKRRVSESNLYVTSKWYCNCSNFINMFILNVSFRPHTRNSTLIAKCKLSFKMAPHTSHDSAKFLVFGVTS